MKNRVIKGRAKYFFTYSTSERNGTITLAVILLLLIFGSFIYRPISSATIVDNETYEMVDSFFRSLQYVDAEVDFTFKPNVLTEEIPVPKKNETFFFNPNTISIDSLIDLGLSPKQAQVVVNYRNKGGKFRNPDDFSKIHVIDFATFQRLRPWILIPKDAIVKFDSSVLPEKTFTLELNSADSISLNKLKGIGPSYARRIISYRELLGGFYSINQLSEVYGLNQDIINSLKSIITIDSSRVRKINLNLIGYEELRRHPYLSDYQAKSIVYYRSKRGSINDLSELIDNKLLPVDRYNKIRPYFTIK